MLLPSGNVAYSRFFLHSCRGSICVAACVLSAALSAIAPHSVSVAVAQSRNGPASVAPIAEKLIDAVVNISTSQNVKGPAGVPLPRVPKGSPFEQEFEEFFNRRGGRGPQDRKVSSLGSGFVIDGKEGLIVTNNHVIEGADEITINFHDGNKLKVDKVLGKDTKTDLALLKVTPKRPLASVPFGSSERIKVGDWVMAIGNPFGLGGSLTVGILSAKQRDINSGPYDDFLQTDASINKGNSGGPLFNMDGEVIGVNTAIISPSGGSIGIGFAVPADVAVSVVDQLRRFGETRRGWLGVQIGSITDEMAESLKLRENTGALVNKVTAASPAATAGLVDGDIILKFDGKVIAGVRSLPRVVAQTPVGKEVDVEYLRKGQKRSARIVLGRLAEDDDKDKAAAKDKTPDTEKDTTRVPSPSDPQALVGLKVAPLDDALRKRFTLEAKVKGVVVLEVDPASPAAQKGVRVGDVIVEVAQDAVLSADDIAKSVDKVRKSGRKAVLLRLEDAKGELRFVAVPIQ